MKDVFWFSHDSNASRDIKMMQLKHLYDFWGIGLYWSVIEVLREQPNYRFSCSESGLGLLCTLVMCSDTVRFNNWFNDCIRLGLLKIEENEFFSTSLCQRMQIWEVKKSNGSKGGRPPKTETITETKPKLKAKRNHNRIEQNRIEQNRIEQNITEEKIPFVSFWSVYPVKSGKSKSQQKWDKLSLDEQKEILSHLEWYVNWKQFEGWHHPNPETYLNQKRWLDPKPETKSTKMVF